MKESEKMDKYQDLARELKKLWNMKVTVIPIIIGALSTVSKRLVQGLEDLENKKTTRDHPNYRIIKIGQNTEKSPGDLKRLGYHSNSSEKLSADAGVRNSKRNK